MPVLVALCVFVVIISPWQVQLATHTGNSGFGSFLGMIWLAGIAFAWMLTERKAAMFWFIVFYTIPCILLAGWLL